MQNQDVIIDLYKNPLNRRAIPNADISHSGVNMSCGDRVRMYVKLNKDQTIADVAFEGEGCSITIATASLLTECAKGKSLADVAEWNSLTIFQLLETELGPSRIKCGLLPLETLQQGINQKFAASKINDII